MGRNIGRSRPLRQACARGEISFELRLAALGVGLLARPHPRTRAATLPHRRFDHGMQRLKKALANGALATVSFLVTYLVCEFLFFRFMLPHMSFNIRPHLPDRADFFLQNSKSH